MTPVRDARGDVTTRASRTSPVVIARIAGVLFIVMAVGGFAGFGILHSLLVPGDASATAGKVLASRRLFQLGFIGDLVAFLCDVPVAILLYVLLRPASRAISLVAASFRLVYAAIAGANLLKQLGAVLLLIGADHPSQYEMDQLQAAALFRLNRYEHVFSLALMFFGVHLLLLGVALFKASHFPRFLGVLIAIGGLAYLVDSTSVLLLPAFNAKVARYLAVPMSAELVLALWLLVKGVKVRDDPDAPPGKIPGVARLVFVFAVIGTMIKWTWLLIKGANARKTDRARNFWDMMSRDYDRQTQAKRFEQTRARTIADVRKYLGTGDVVLDYGCATGAVAIELAGNAKRIHGIDLSPRMIAEAKRKAMECKIVNVDFAQSTIFDEGHERGRFDAVLALNVLHLVEEAPKVLTRVRELLKPGGLLVSSTECMGESRSFINVLVLLMSKTRILPHFRFFKVSELEQSIIDGGFRIVEATSSYDFPSQPIRFIAARKT